MTNKPTKKFECGGVSVAVWNNEIETESGKRTVERVTMDRRYRDTASGEWKSTQSFNASDMPKLILALQQAYEFITFKPRRNVEEEVEDGSA